MLQFKTEGLNKSIIYQELLFFPGTSTFKIYVSNNLIQNCDISVDDISIVNIIYGPLVLNIQGQMTRQRPQAHDKIVKVSLPHMVAQHHLKVSLSMDLFFANGIIFFHTKSYKLNFVSTQYCKSRSLKIIKAGLSIIQNKYKGRSFEIEDCHGDNESDKASLNDFL